MLKIFTLEGHRGVGKTTLLENIKTLSKSFNKNYLCYDLDQFIESQEKTTVTEIFKKHGESYFRELEKKYFDQILDLVLQKNGSHAMDHVYISLGAGFSSEISQDLTRIWVQRATDSFGRVFNSSRPRLDQNLDPLKEYASRFEKRTERFNKNADIIWALPEGSENTEIFLSVMIPDLANKALGYSKEQSIAFKLRSAIYTIPAISGSKLKKRIHYLRSLGIKTFEIRNDIFSDSEIPSLVTEFGEDSVLLSFRRRGELFKDFKLKRDWDINLGPSPFKNLYILSSHSSDFGLDVTQNGIRAEYFKWAPVIKTFKELSLLDQWAEKKPKVNMAFAISEDQDSSKWKWHRVQNTSKQDFYFVRDSHYDSLLDQPSVYDVLSSVDPDFKHFAAVLGSPVMHSRSPEYHKKFFALRNMNYHYVDLKLNEATSETLDILKKSGLKAASITSPLKKIVSRVLGEGSSKAFNTLCFNQDQAQLLNTDAPALIECLNDFKSKSVIVLGTGALKRSIEKIFPDASFYSVQKAKIIQGAELLKYDVCICATQIKSEDFLDKIKTQLIYDLQYNENSWIKNYARSKNIHYISGAIFFEKQAQLQQQFWDSLIKV